MAGSWEEQGNGTGWCLAGFKGGFQVWEEGWYVPDEYLCGPAQRRPAAESSLFLSIRGLTRNREVKVAGSEKIRDGRL